ncbi:MAG: cupin domain-containing protein [Candidatus Hodarchaeota archaeon]
MYQTKDVPDSEYEPYLGKGCRGVLIHRMLDPESSSQSFALRTYILESGGHTAQDAHEHEHGVYVMHGVLQVRAGDNLLELRQGDVIHIAPNESHQFLNPWPQKTKFLCIRNFL